MSTCTHKNSYPPHTHEERGGTQRQNQRVRKSEKGDGNGDRD